jgi:hypothetical protein
VTDPAEKAALRQLKANKYPQLKIPPDSQVQLFHVMG